jgi:23S rRNA (guanosine2251-2'-O)-methyltransferase
VPNDRDRQRPGVRQPRYGSRPESDTSQKGTQRTPRRGTPRTPERGEPVLQPRGEILYGRNAVAEALRGRRQCYRLYLAEGVRQDARITDLERRAAADGIPTERVPRHVLDDATAGANHQGVALDASPYPYGDLDTIRERPGTILVLDHVQDPQNVGTLLRAAEACGVAGVILPEDRAASITPAVVNASAGAVEHVLIGMVTNLARAVETLKDAGRWAIGLEADEQAVDLFTGDLPLPAILIVGAEGSGIGPNLRRHCDVLAMIPMVGRVASLNVSTAGAIGLFELFRRERAQTV